MSTNTSAGAGSDEQPRVFTVPADWAFPRLGKRVVPDGARVDADSDATSWSAYDTDRRDLARFGAALTRRGSGHWRLRLDGVVVTAEGTARAVPAQLRDALLGVRAGAPLRRVSDGSTQLTTRVVVDADDRVLGEVDDVRYRSTPAVEVSGDRGGQGSGDAGADRPAEVTTRHIEVIAVEPDFGAAVARRLIKAGARPLEGASARPRTVGAAVTAYLGEQRAVILRGDVRLRRGADTVGGGNGDGGPSSGQAAALAAIHPTRVAVRRLRSVLRVVDVADPERTSALDAELAWFSGLLGDVRDLQVLREHLAASVRRARNAVPDEHPDGADVELTTVLDAAERAIEAALDERLAATQARLNAAMRGRRYLALLQELTGWHKAAPFTADAAAGVGAVQEYARRAERTERKRRRQAHDVESWHRARKAAKRTRYVSEFAAGPLSGKRAAQAEAAGKAAKKRQTKLGDRQDAAMAADFLADVAVHAAGAAAFGCGVLWAAERRSAGD